MPVVTDVDNDEEGDEDDDDEWQVCHDDSEDEASNTESTDDLMESDDTSSGQDPFFPDTSGVVPVDEDFFPTPDDTCPGMGNTLALYKANNLCGIV